MNDEQSLTLSALVILIVLVVIGTGVVIGGRACNTAQKATFDRVDQEFDRKTFEESTSYRAGLRRDFDELKIAYSKAKSDDERGVIVSTMRHRAQGAPPEAIPEDIKSFLATH